MFHWSPRSPRALRASLAQRMRFFSLISPVLTMTAMLAAPRAAHAAPYASNVTVTGTTVSFVLNQTADIVQYQINGGALMNLPDTTAGAKTFELNAAGDSFQIRVKDTDATGYTVPTGGTVAADANGLSQVTNAAGFNLLSSDTNPLNRFNSPRGVAVVTSSGAPNFGTAYVSNSVAGTSGGRAVGRGLYALKPDQSDAFGYGNNATYGSGTLPLATAGTSTNSPYRITAASDGEIYVADFSDGTGLVGRLSPNLATSNLVLANTGGPTALPPGRNHGSVTTAYPVLGQGGALTLFTLDEDLTTNYVTGAGSATDRNSLWRYEIPSTATPHTGLPTKVASPVLAAITTSDLDVGADGKFYVTQNRNAGGEAGLRVLNASGATIFDSFLASRAILGNTNTVDIIRNVISMAVSPKQDWIALSLINNDIVAIPLVGGIPDLARRVSVETGVKTIQSRDIAFDAAGNIHYVSSGQGLYRVLGPGGTTESITNFDGTTLSFAQTQTPTVASIRRASANRDQSPSVDFTVTFNQSVTGVDADDFLVVKTGNILGGSVTGVAGSGATYTVTVSGLSGNPGTIGLNLVDDNSISAGVDNLLGGADLGDGNFTGQIFTRSSVAASPVALISEFRLRGPGGSADEYIEIYNKTGADLNINGWKIQTDVGAPESSVVQDTPVPADTPVIPAFGHFLFRGSTYSLNAYGAANANLSADANVKSAIALIDGSGAVQDAVGFTTSDPGAREGAGIASAPDINGTATSQHAFIRDFNGAQPKDTGNNATDFIPVLTNAAPTTGLTLAGTNGNITTQLGAPNPEGLASPVNVNSQVVITLLQPEAGLNNAPNRLRTGSGNGGTLLLRRTIRNTGSQPLSRVRLLMTRITSQGSPTGIVPGTQADVRLISSGNESIALPNRDTNGVIIPAGQDGAGTTLTPVYAALLEAPSNATSTSGTPVVTGGGGGLGSSVVFDLTFPTPLLPNTSANYGFNLQVATGGTYLVAFNVLAISQPAP